MIEGRTMSTRHIHTYGEIVGNDLVELIDDPSQDNEFKFSWLLKRPLEEHIGRALTFRVSDDQPRIYHLPEGVDPALLRAVRFPPRPESYGTGRELIDNISQLIRQYTSLTELQTSLVAFSLLATWVAERSNFPVCLAIVGPPSTERRQLLRLLHCFLYRPLHLADCKVSEVLCLPPTLNPTLLMEHCEDLSQLRRILRITSSREAYTLSKRRTMISATVNAYCAKVICLDDSWTASFPDWPAIEIVLRRTDRQLPALDDRAQEQIASEYQAKLMKYRVNNYHHQPDSSLSLPHLSPASREIARSLGLCFSGDHELQELLVAKLAEQDKQVTKPTENVLISATLEALLYFCHERRNGKVHVAEIATRFNRILEGRGEFLRLNARAVSTLLGKLELEADGRDAVGSFLLLLNVTEERIHKLAAEHNILADSRSSLCENCTRFLPDDPELNLDDLIRTIG
jgi:hypothetical protein